MLEIKNLHVTVDEQAILNGLNLAVKRARCTPSWARTARASRRSPTCWPASDGYEVDRGRDPARRRGPAGDASRTSAPRKGLFLAFQYPVEIPGVATMTFLRTALNAQRKARGEAELTTPEFLKLVREAAGKLDIDTEMLQPRASTSASPAARRSATRSCRWRCCSRGSACSTRPTPASTSTR